MLHSIQRFYRDWPFIAWSASALLVLLVAYLLWPAGNKSEQSMGRGGAWSMPVPVRTTPVTTENLPVRIAAIGTVTALNTSVVRARVDGLLESILFKEGDIVKAGQALAQIDPAPYKVQLAQAEGQRQQNLAQIKSAESDLERYRTLYEQDSISRQQLEQQDARVNELRGSLAADQAQVDDAQLKLSYTKITAPISGRLGLRRVDVGNLINTSDSEGLVTITQMQPISVIFTIPETQLMDVRTAYSNGGSKKPLVVEAWDRDNRQKLATGQLLTIDNQIDPTTGTLRLKAQFDNADEVLFPSQFVNIRLNIRVIANAVTIPIDAVQYGSQGTYVYIIVDNKATIRPIKIGPAEEGRIAILEGLSAGEEVVLEGLDRLREGRDVILNPPEQAAPEQKKRSRPGGQS